MEEEIQDVAADTNAEVQEDTNINETGVEETPEVLKEKLAEALRAKAQLTARTRKAEEENKALKAKPQNNNQSNDPQLTDELKLIARGLSDEEIEQAKVIAKGRGIALNEAIKDPLFQVFQSDLKEKERREKAKLGATRGSGESQDEAIIKPDMTREEHQEAFKKVMGK